ncbi:serine--tRNA ligase, partial [Micromonospora chalcea]
MSRTRRSGRPATARQSQLDEVQSRLRAVMSELPNLPADDVVAGGKEANR